MALRLATRAARPAFRQVRALHIENKVDHAIPGGSKKGPVFSTVFWALYGTGFILPFAACWYSHEKSVNRGGSF